jgi:hypothetical protein
VAAVSAATFVEALDAAIPAELYHDDIHGLPAWRKDMTYRLAEEIRAELTAPAGVSPARVSGDFWPPPQQPQRRAPSRTQHIATPQASPQQEGA